MKLEGRALDWSLKHLLKHSDGDLFPFPFEFKYIEEKWIEIKQNLMNIEIENHIWQGLREVVVPKETYAFRKAAQLDPIDSILFTGLIYQIGPLIEGSRIPKSEEVVFSYRYQPDSEYNFYDTQKAMEDFWKKSKDLSKSSYFVLITDITDFYNQIYHHNIENQLIECGIDKVFIKAIKNLLQTYTAKISRGIPIGPHGFHLIAEMSLIPIDKFLQEKGISFCRYCDDIHIFCKTEEDRIAAINDLFQILNAYTLVLNRSKTKPMDSAAFIKTANEEAIDKPINEDEKEILRIIKSKNANPYDTIDYSRFTPEELKRFSPEIISNIIELYLNQSSPNFIRLRWLFRRLAQTCVPTAIDFTVQNIPRLLPALGDSFFYLNNASKNYSGNWTIIGEKLIKTLKMPVIRTNIYLQMVLVNIFTKLNALDHLGEILKLYDVSPPILRREILIAAKTLNASKWLKVQKNEFLTSDPWSRRALLIAAEILPPEEAQFWLKDLKKKEISLLERYIIESVLGKI